MIWFILAYVVLIVMVFCLTVRLEWTHKRNRDNY